LIAPPARITARDEKVSKREGSSFVGCRDDRSSTDASKPQFPSTNGDHPAVRRNSADRTSAVTTDERRRLGSGIAVHFSRVPRGATALVYSQPRNMQLETRLKSSGRPYRSGCHSFWQTTKCITESTSSWAWSRTRAARRSRCSRVRWRVGCVILALPSSRCGSRHAISSGREPRLSPARRRYLAPHTPEAMLGRRATV
jgi:hypothetical protein